MSKKDWIPTPIVIEAVISDHFDIADFFNRFFVNIVPNLKISSKKPFKLMKIKLISQSQKAINKFKYPSSMNTIKSKKNQTSKLFI